MFGEDFLKLQSIILNKQGNLWYPTLEASVQSQGLISSAGC
jgi:hypothetical protein